MKIVISVLLAVIMLMSAACAGEAEKPPVLTLDWEGIIETPVMANWSWSYPAGNEDEWTGTEACGMAPTDPAVFEMSERVLLMEDQTYTIKWNGTPPDELIVFSWDTAVFTDQEHADDYEMNPEIILRKENGKITLKPDRVYHFQAKWVPSEEQPRPYGNADYYLVTEKIIIDDGPGSVMMGGWTPSSDPGITEDLYALFEKGTAALTGAAFKPAAYLGSQVVAGTNHAFLCQKITAYPGMETEPAYVIVYLYEDLQGNVSILNIADFDIGALCTYGE